MDEYFVAIQKGKNRKQLLEKTLNMIKDKIPDVSGRIIIKPNFLSANNLLASTTPETLEIVVRFFRKLFLQNEIYIAEGAHVSKEYIQKYNINQLVDKYKAKLFSIDYDEKIWDFVEFEDLVGEKCKARVSNTYMTSEYIVSLTVPKTHANIGLSLSMKNLVGILHPDDRTKFHGLTDNVPQNIKNKYKSRLYDRDDKLGVYCMKLRNILPITNKTAQNLQKGSEIVRKNLYHLYEKIQPNLCIIDGFDGMQGNGPWNGENAHLNTIIIGNNTVATDLVTSKIMQQPIKDIGYINYIDNLESFMKNTKILGNTIEEVKKQLKPHKFEPYL